MGLGGLSFIFSQISKIKNWDLKIMTMDGDYGEILIEEKSEREE
jgi:hypothetical protein